MNVLLNIFPVRAGGGQQVANNFIKVIAQNNFGHTWYIFVGKDSELHRQALQLLPHENILAMPYSYRARIFNRRLLRRYVTENQIDIIYNYAPILSIKGIPQVVRTVYSNLYFPEINFWADYPLITRLKKSIIDYFRLKGTIRANGLIFENKSMRDRVVSLFKYDWNKTVFIEPSLTLFDESQNHPDFEFLLNIKEFKILYLSSWHLNKNIHSLPLVAAILRDKGIEVKFILSLDKNEAQIEQFLLKKIMDYEVGSYFQFIGKVKSDYVHQVVKSSDTMILLSKLECFSSNIIEAYSFNKPIFIADEPWSRSVCRDAAIYVDRNNPEDIAAKIIQIVKDKTLYEFYVEKGSQSLKQFNTPTNKVEKQVEFLEFIKKYVV